MAPTFAQLNVFWSTNSEENAKALEEVLPEVGFSLRHELSQLRVMGVVPHIYFVRDKHLQNASKVDYLLSIADYGDDHVPLNQGSDFKNRPGAEETVIIGMNEHLKDDGISVEEDLENNDTSSCETMPIMRHDVFNLEHKLILSKITKSLKKSRAAHRFQPNLAIESEGLDISKKSTPSSDNLSKEERKAAMAKFILSRKILREKQTKNKHNSQLNVGPSETKNEDYDYEYEDFRTEDYIIEDYHEEDQKYKQ